MGCGKHLIGRKALGEDGWLDLLFSSQPGYPGAATTATTTTTTTSSSNHQQPPATTTTLKDIPPFLPIILPNHPPQLSPSETCRSKEFIADDGTNGHQHQTHGGEFLSLGGKFSQQGVHGTLMARHRGFLFSWAKVGLTKKRVILSQKTRNFKVI